MNIHVEGIRVVRGPDWGTCNHGNEDGGEGHVGTVTQDNEDNTVEVVWDSGQAGTYATGRGMKCALKVLDSAPNGLKHPGVTCNGCKAKDFSGTRWKCSTCKDFDLCTPCYFGNKHDVKHAFIRMVLDGIPGKLVSTRSEGTKVKATGIFKGASVQRGRDWVYSDQDGGDGKIGTVLDIVNHGTMGGMRDSAKVAWSANKTGNTYRLGYRGHVDLKYTKPAEGYTYCKDHLMMLCTIPAGQARPQSPGVGTRASGQTTMMRSFRSTIRAGSQSQRPQIGDKVCIELPAEVLKELQRGHGGYSMRMKEYIGEAGELKKLETNGDFLVKYGDKEFQCNPDVIRKVPALKVGDTVRIEAEASKVEAMQKRHGGWNDEMSAVLGKVGKIVKVDSDGDVAVAFGSKAFVFNPACCEPAPGQAVQEPGAGGGGAGRGRVRGLVREPAGGAKPKTVRRSEAAEDDDDHEGDEAAELLGRMVAQLFLLGAAAAASDSGGSARAVVSAAAQNDHKRVDDLLQNKPDLKDAKDQGLTALIISSHQGHIEVVKVLLKHKADLEITEDKGNTALMAALMKSHDDVAIMLMNAGANINKKNNVGRTAVHFSAAMGANKALKVLLNKGADINTLDANENTPLHDAICMKNADGVTLLVAAPNINMRRMNNKGHSPLHVAAMKDDEMSVEKIVKKDPSIKNASSPKNGYTALHVASINDNTGVVKKLFEFDVAVDARAVNNVTPLHLACHQGYIDSVKLLVEHSAAVNAASSDGNAPLHHTVMGQRHGQGAELAALLGIRITTSTEINERVTIACYLIQHGANVQLRNKANRTALECCPTPKMRDPIKEFAEKHAKEHGAPGGGQANAARAAQLLQMMMLLSLECTICEDRVINSVLMPCGHCVCCAECSFTIRDCPECGQAIQERLDCRGNRLQVIQCGQQ